MSQHKKPAVGLWATLVLLVILVLYPLSVGPSWWLTNRIAAGDSQSWSFDVYYLVYGPLNKFLDLCPDPVNEAHNRYCNWFRKSPWYGEVE